MGVHQIVSRKYLSLRTARSRNLRWEIHLSQQMLEAWIGAQTILRIYFYESETWGISPRAQPQASGTLRHCRLSRHK